MSEGLATELDFILVGAPRAGTTSIWRTLRQHPQVYLPATKEIHFHAREMLREGDRTRDSSYVDRLYRNARPGDTVGLIGPCLMSYRPALHRVALECPNAKVLVMLRNPVDLIRSLHMRLVYSGDETEPNLRRAVERDAPDRESAIRHSSHYLKMAELGTQLSTVRELFPADHIHVTVFDDLTTNPMHELERLLSFLNLAHIPGLEIGHENARKRARSRFVQDRLLSRPSPSMRRVARLIPDRMRWRVRSLLQAANSTPIPTEEPDLIFEDLLRQALEPEINKLQDLLGRDLTSWRERSRAAK